MKWEPIKTEGQQFDIDLLAKLEKTIVERTKKKSESWIKGVWKWLLLAGFMLGKPEKYEEFLQITSKPVPSNIISDAVNLAVSLSYQEADKDIKTSGIKPPPGPPSDNKTKLNALWYARTSSALKMKEWADGMRNDVRWQVVRAIKEGISKNELARRLEERWDHYGQSFQKIAVTELNDAYNSGYLLALPEGSYVTVPKIHDDKVCYECKELLEGKVFEVLHHPPEHLTRQVLETATWSGKSNIGRKKEDYVPCVPLHVSCRHHYVFLSGVPVRRDEQ